MKTTNFAIFFDNAGFATLITKGYCHAYDDSDYGQELAGAVADLLGGSSPKNWDGNDPECRSAQELADRSTDADEIRSIIASGNWPDQDEDGEADVDFEGGDTERNFWAALRSETARRAAQAASGRATTAKLGPEGIQARAKAGAAARWGEKYHVECLDEQRGGWVTDLLGPYGDNPQTMTACRADIRHYRMLSKSEASWKGAFRIVRESDGAEMERHYIR